MTDFETKIAKYEAELIHAMDIYFNARPQLLRSGHETKLFEAGFQKAWNTIAGNRNDILDEATAVILAEPDEIRTSTSYRQGYVRAIRDKAEAIEKLKQ